MSVPMALFGLVWLLRVRSSVCACAGCRKERAAPLSLPQPQPQTQTQPQTAAAAADTAVPQLGYDVITVESFTKDANVQTEFEDEEDIDGMGDAFADRNIELQVCGTSVSAGNFEYPRSQELDNKIEEEVSFNVLTQSPGRSSWREKRHERDVQPLDAEWEEVWVREQVQLERGAGGLGLSIAGGAGAGGELCVTRLAERGAAQLDGRLQLGDIIEQVNDIPLAGASHAMAVDALQRAGAFVNIRVRRARRPRVVALSRGARGLGLGVAGGADAAAGARGVFVSHVAPGGAAAADGRLRTGDRILAVVDVHGVETSLSNVTHAQAVTALRNAGERLSLVILPAARISDTHRIYSQRTQATSCSTLHELLEGQEAFDIPRCVRIVRLTRSGSRLGMDIVGGAEAEAGGVFVSGVAAGGAAAGRLYRGDRILSVDGRDLSRATHEQAAAALKFSSDSVTIAAQYQPDQYARLRARIQAINAASHVVDSNDLPEDYPR